MRRHGALIAAAGCAVLLAASAAVFRAELAQAADKMRRDYVAWRHVQDAAAAVRGRPVNRPLAVVRMERALELAPDEQALRAAAPEVFMAAGDYDRALRILARLPEPDTLLLGYCLLKVGAKERGARLVLNSAHLAGEMHRRGLLTERQYALQMNNAGYLLADAGVELAQAKAMIELALSIMPLDANIIDSMGWVHYRLGDVRKAIFYLERAVRLQTGPREPELYYHLGAAYAREGRIARATKHLRIALRLDPHHDEARREMNRLNWLLPLPMLACGDDPLAPA